MTTNTNSKQISAESWKVFDGLLNFYDEIVVSNNSGHIIAANSKVKMTSESWSVFDDLMSSYGEIVENKYKELTDLLEQWDATLSDLGGDPTHHDWTRFRPLRLEREEDWSDWLAYLIATSETGVFSKDLLKIPYFDTEDYVDPKRVEREVAHGGYRADIIVQWKNKYFSHIEVKVGDTCLEKTGNTGVSLMSRFKSCPDRWMNFILLPDSDMIYWEQELERNEDNCKIVSLTWSDVCVAIRRALQSDEGVTWRVWAYTFLGAVEQKIIGFPGHQLFDRPQSGINEKILILNEALYYDQ